MPGVQDTYRLHQASRLHLRQELDTHRNNWEPLTPQPFPKKPGLKES